MLNQLQSAGTKRWKWGRDQDNIRATSLFVRDIPVVPNTRPELSPPAASLCPRTRYFLGQPTLRILSREETDLKCYVGATQQTVAYSGHTEVER